MNRPPHVFVMCRRHRHTALTPECRRWRYETYSHIERATTRQVVALVAALAVTLTVFGARPAAAENDIEWVESAAVADAGETCGGALEASVNPDDDVCERGPSVSGSAGSSV